MKQKLTLCKIKKFTSFYQILLFLQAILFILGVLENFFKEIAKIWLIIYLKLISWLMILIFFLDISIQNKIWSGPKL
jgi:hypothetical protein